MKRPEVFNKVVNAHIDPENDFSPRGSLPNVGGFETIDPMNRDAVWTRQNNGLVVVTADRHRSDTRKHFDKFGAHCVEGTWGAEFVDELEIAAGDIILIKGTNRDEDSFSGFEATNDDGLTLETLLTPVAEERVAAIFDGWDTDYCIKESVFGALALSERLTRESGYQALGVFVVRDAIAPADITPGDGQRAIEEMMKAGARFITSTELASGQVIEIRG